jgi:cellulose synthase/poly-beta-1,6-N-acetylglucosamine synthase-like glycosyltransferase
MMHVKPGPWNRSASLGRRAADVCLVVLGLSLSVAFARATLDDPTRAFIWSLVLAFYFLFYRRIGQVIYWSFDTYRRLRDTLPHTAAKVGLDRADDRKLPTFHILIASYDAGESIGPVVRAIANLDYPQDRYHAWIITEHAEFLAKASQRDALLGYTSNSAFDVARDARLLPLFWQCAAEQFASLAEWVDQVTSGTLRPYLGHSNIPPVLLHDLLYRLLRLRTGGDIHAGEALSRLGLTPNEIVWIERETRRIEARGARIAADFGRLLGSLTVYRREDIELQLIALAVRKRRLQRMSARVCQRFACPGLAVHRPTAQRVGGTIQRVIRSTQDVVREVLADLTHPNIHHLDPHKRGFKPGALNVAFRHIQNEKLLQAPGETFFVIIDSDSLLPAHALRAVAGELQVAGPVPPIMQMVSIPMANFFSAGWYSRFIAFADAIGAVGKWARSTRRQLKPDLHAGSGVVVPASVTTYIAEHIGGPWTETTLTEDARLIVGQFGMMNGVRNKTRMAPTYLLEAVPADAKFWSTYQSFWNQRRRWTTGGYDEFFYMLGAPARLRHTRFDPQAKRWRAHVPSCMDRLATGLRQLHRTALWVWDHFWWGIGGGIVLTHWWLISAAIAAPSAPIAVMGFMVLLLAPLLFLLTSGRHLAAFIPGGLSFRTAALLYLCSFCAIWLYCLPVIATQIACLFGFRSKLLEWKPTHKPRYQLDAVARIEEVT